MILAAPANLQRVPSPLLYFGRRGRAAFVPEPLTQRAALAAVAYLAGLSATLAPRASSGSYASGPRRVTQDGASRLTQTGALRVTPLAPLLCARAEPTSSAALRTACLATAYAGAPQHDAAEPITLRSAALAAGILSASVSTRSEPARGSIRATAALCLPAGIRATTRAVRHRSACLSTLYALA